jgi:uncharacterized protein
MFFDDGVHSMKVALIGATGRVGSKILTEAVARGHKVTAIVRSPEKLAPHQKVIAKKGDVSDKDGLATLFAGHDAAISAYNPGLPGGDHAIGVIIDAAKQAKVRLLVVGGAATLETAPGKRVIDAPDFPTAWKVGALKTAEFLDRLRRESELDWTFLSPAAMLVPGERTGKFRLGGDQLITDAKGESKISFEDYAVAMIDELEQAKHRRSRFTLAY